MTARRVMAQFRFELALLARNGESLLLVAGIPVLLLVFFSVVDVLPTDVEVADPVDFLTPGVLALAVMSTAFTNVAIATGFEREYGVLQRLGASPLRRSELLAAKVAVVLVVVSVQVVVLGVVGLLLGWGPSWGGVGAAGAGTVVAVAAFVALGLLVAGTMRGLMALAAANAIYVVLLLLSGMIIPLAELPDAIASASRLLPSTALAEILHGALREDESVPARAWPVLAGWAFGGAAAASRWFRWTPTHH